jgi:hypothetical protein
MLVIAAMASIIIIRVYITKPLIMHVTSHPWSLVVDAGNPNSNNHLVG